MKLLIESTGQWVKSSSQWIKSSSQWIKSSSPWIKSFDCFQFVVVTAPPRRGYRKILMRLINLVFSTDIFSKRRKICAWMKKTQSWLPKNWLYFRELFECILLVVLSSDLLCMWTNDFKSARVKVSSLCRCCHINYEFNSAARQGRASNSVLSRHELTKYPSIDPVLQSSLDPVLRFSRCQCSLMMNE